MWILWIEKFTEKLFGKTKVHAGNAGWKVNVIMGGKQDAPIADDRKRRPPVIAGKY